MNSSVRCILVLAHLFGFTALGVIPTADRLAAQCTPTGPADDCNSNGVVDGCDILFGQSDDCNGNGLPDECDIASGACDDCNLDGIPDECEPVGAAILTPPTGAVQFGAAVAISGDLAVVGDPAFTNGPPGSGGAWVYRRVGTQWVLEAWLVPSNPTPDLAFGTAVAIRDGLVAVGAPGESTILEPRRGAVFLFRQDAGSWVQEEKLTATDAGSQDELGVSLAIGPDRILAGAWQSQHLGVSSGAVHVFAHDGQAWSEEAKLTPDLPVDGARFGAAIDLDGALLAIGATRDDTATATDAGAVYTFADEVTGWSLIEVLFANAPETGAEFGRSVAVSGDRLLVGASGAVSAEGRAYLYDRSGGVYTLTQVLMASDRFTQEEFAHQVGFAGEYLLITAYRADGQVGAAYLFGPDGTELDRFTGPGSTTGSQFGEAGATDGSFGVIGVPAEGQALAYRVAPMPDCNGNLIDDICEITGGVVPDCNLNQRPDGCDIALSFADDCDADGIPDACALANGFAFDCNQNGVLDSCDLSTGVSLDCNGNGIPDECDTGSGTSLDCNANLVPDECEQSVDIVSPVFSGVPADIVVSVSPDACQQVAIWTPPVASDDCGIAVVTASAQSGDSFPVGETTVSYTALDLFGNHAEATFTVTVVDDTPPIFAGLPPDLTLVSPVGQCGAIANWVEPTATDTCGLASISSDRSSGDFFEVGVSAVTITATDLHGNATTGSFLVTVLDTVDPSIISVPADIVLANDPGECGAVASWMEPIAIDDCGIMFLDSDTASGSTFPVGTTVVRYRANDFSANDAEASFSVTVEDLEPPTIQGMPQDLLLAADAGTCGALVSWAAPMATDNCSIVGFSSDSLPGSFFPVGVTPVTYEATDVHGNVTNALFTITVEDFAAPEIVDLPADRIVAGQPGLCGATVTWIEPTAVDPCGVASLVGDRTSGTFFDVGTTVVTYTASDEYGNQTSGSFAVTVEDTEAPEITGLPADLLVPADLGQCGAVVGWIVPGATDACAVAAVVCDPEPGSSFSVGTTPVTVTATDVHGNATEAVFSVTVEDAEAPMIIEMPTDLFLETDTGECGAVAEWSPPVASDNCSVVMVSTNLAAGTLFPVGSTPVIVTATDDEGNTTDAVFTVTVEDTEAPTIIGLPADLLLSSAAGECGVVATWVTPGATDNCGPGSVTSDPAPGSFLPVGETVVTVTAVDAYGNAAEESFTVTVQDLEAPVIAGVPSDLVVSNDPGGCGSFVSWAVPDATDNCTVENFTSDRLPGAFFPVGVTVVTYTAADAHGNATSDAFTVTVLDEEAPTLAGMPTDLFLDCDPGTCGAVAIWTEPIASDNCAVDSVSADANNGQLFPVGTTTVTYSVLDLSGHLATASFEVTVIDTEAPIVLEPPVDIVRGNDDGACGAVVEWADPVWADNCSLASVASDTASGEFFPVGTTQVTYTATDVHGNAAVASFTVTVEDFEPPSILDVPTDLVVGNDAGGCAAIATWTEPIAEDNCGATSLGSDRFPGESFPLGVHTVTYTATDAHGNLSNASFTVTVADTESPVIIDLPANFTIGSDPGQCGAVVTWSEPAALDNCSLGTMTADHSSGDMLPVGITEVTYSASDTFGNVSTQSFLVTVEDTESPEVVGVPLAIQVVSDPGQCGALVFWPEPFASDNCGLQTLESDRVSGDFFAVGTTLVTYSAIDLHGNPTSEEFTVTVEDTEAPVIAGMPTDLVLSHEPGTCGATVFWPEPNATDPCGMQSFAPDHLSGSTFPVGTTIVTYTASDVHGVSASESFTVTVVDDELPTLSGLSANITVTNTPGSCGAVVTWPAPVAADNCAVASLVSNRSSGEMFPAGTTLVNYTATDVHGNVRITSFTVTVIDIELPSLIGMPADQFLETAPGECAAVATWTAPTASDNCGVTSLLASHASGQTFDLGTTTVTYRALDAFGNQIMASFTVTVTDTLAPVISGLPTDLVVGTDAAACGASVDWPEPTVAENCTLVEVTRTHLPGAVFPVGATTVTYTAVDGSGNTSSASFQVVVTDDELPAIAVGPDLTVTADPQVCTAALLVPGPTVSDNCGVATLVNDFTGTADASAVYPFGMTAVVWTVTDVHGNARSVTQWITVTVDETDCNGNGTPDVCDLAEGTSFDCNGNGIADECEIDCNGNGIPDDCDIAAGTSLDANGNGEPDECEGVFLRGDSNEDGWVGFTDAIFILQYLMGIGGVSTDCLDALDTDDTEQVDLADAVFLLRFIFVNDVTLAAPFPNCGIDADGDSIGCGTFDSCP